MMGLTEWLSEPFNQGQSAFKWFLFVGLIVTALIMWGVIIKDVRGVV
jgi:hypothetical protein